jgi:hypothetical protein
VAPRTAWRTRSGRWNRRAESPPRESAGGRGGRRSASNLLSAARVGLFDAARRFNATRGIGFEAFASPRVLGAIVDELRDEHVLQRQTTGRPLELRALLDATVCASAPRELHEEASLAGITAWRSVYGVRALAVSGSMSGAVDDDALRADESIERTERFAALERAIAGLGRASGCSSSTSSPTT